MYRSYRFVMVLTKARYFTISQATSTHFTLFPTYFYFNYVIVLFHLLLGLPNVFLPAVFRPK